MPVENFDRLHRLHQEWKKDLLLNEKEIKSLTEELTELASQKLDHDQLARIEHFQNSLIRQKEVVNDLLQQVIKGDKMMSEENGDNAQLHMLHNKLQDDMDTFDRLFVDLREEFKGFKRSLLKA
ncbi:hypothetical protein ACFOTA_16075 [Chitinophaga sp. GCM10012297]|uniref:Uncharacterized protein n=1 Tax=Chitinophaga chungangae TaxID=2821488 RepID=A0ABS3YGC2_9BACT|nr:hypothetical protein [Chitinophaga chungangae]MBO9153737.1 hypothetical protein [Chitinophaga chungangae]